MTHLSLLSSKCLVTSLRPQMYLRLVFQFSKGSFFYTHDLGTGPKSVSSASTVLLISGVIM